MSRATLLLIKSDAEAKGVPISHRFDGPGGYVVLVKGAEVRSFAAWRRHVPK